MLKKSTTILFLLLIFSLPFGNVIGLSIFGQSIQPTEIVFLAAALLFTISIFTGQAKIKRDASYFPVFIYLCALLVSVLFSVDPSQSWIKYLGVSYLAGLYLLTCNQTLDEVFLRRVIYTWIAAAGVASATAVLTAVLFYWDRNNWLLGYTLSHYGTLPAGNYPRVRSTFQNANMFCHYLGISWMLLLAGFRQGWVTRPILYSALALFSLAAFFTLSPGIGAIFVGSGLWACTGGRAPRLAGWKKYAVLSSAAFAFIFGALFLAVTLVRIDDGGNGIHIRSMPTARILTWSDSIDTFRENFITGKGLGTGAASVGYDGQTLTDAHNLFLNVAAESGVLGLAAILYLGIWLMFSTLRPDSMGNSRELLKGIGIAFFISFFYQGLVGSFEDARHLWVLMGMLAAVGASVHVPKRKGSSE